MYKYCFIIVFAFFIQSCVAVQTRTDTGNTEANIQLDSILESEGFDALKQTLNHIVQERSETPNQTQHFFISKYPTGENQTYMFWQEARMLWIMHLGGEDEESWLGVRYPSSGQLIDLNTSVVNTQDEVGGSSYLVTKEWASHRMFDAIIHGDLIIIDKD